MSSSKTTLLPLCPLLNPHCYSSYDDQGCMQANVIFDKFSASLRLQPSIGILLLIIRYSKSLCWKPTGHVLENTVITRHCRDQSFHSKSTGRVKSNTAWSHATPLKSIGVVNVVAAEKMRLSFVPPYLSRAYAWRIQPAFPFHLNSHLQSISTPIASNATKSFCCLKAPWSSLIPGCRSTMAAAIFALGLLFLAAWAHAFHR